MYWLSGTLAEINATQKKKITQQQGTRDTRTQGRGQGTEGTEGRGQGGEDRGPGSGARDLGMAQAGRNNIKGQAEELPTTSVKKTLESVAFDGSART